MLKPGSSKYGAVSSDGYAPTVSAAAAAHGRGRRRPRAFGGDARDEGLPPLPPPPPRTSAAVRAGVLGGMALCVGALAAVGTRSSAARQSSSQLHATSATATRLAAAVPVQRDARPLTAPAPPSSEEKQLPPPPAAPAAMAASTAAVAATAAVAQASHSLEEVELGSDRNADAAIKTGGSGGGGGGGSGSASDVLPSSLSSSSFSFRTYNAYTRESPIAWATPWEHLAEPHRSSVFQAVCSGSTLGSSSSSSTCSCSDDEEEGEGQWQWVWTMYDDGSGSGSSSTYTGRTVEHTFTTLGRHAVTLQCIDAAGTATAAAASPSSAVPATTEAAAEGTLFDYHATAEAAAVVGDAALVAEAAATAATTEAAGYYSYSRDVMVKYVRREIRALSSDDRTRFLDALQTLYRVPTAAGRNIYGDGYRGMESFVAQHLDGAGQLECDHWHDDAGIVTHHVAYTLQLEQVLQLLDPSVSVPYWEYTLDATLYRNLADSPIFGDDWLGEMSPGGPFKTPRSGRWAFTRIARAAELTGATGEINYATGATAKTDATAEKSLGADASDETVAMGPSKAISAAAVAAASGGGRTGAAAPSGVGGSGSVGNAVGGATGNPWGLLRSAWNTNPSPFLTRHDEVNGAAGFFAPTCETYAKCFRSATLAAMNNCLNGATHGPVHILLGGEWGHPDEQFLQEWGLFGKVVLIAKSLWRRGYLRVPASCRSSTNGEEEQLSSTSTTANCRTECPAALLQAHNLTAYDVLLDSKALLWTAKSSRGKIYFDTAANRYRIAGTRRHHSHETTSSSSSGSSAPSELSDSFVESEFSASGPAEEEAVWQRLLAALCNPAFVGEMFTAAAPWDPVFWVIHPSAERLLGQRRLAAEAQGGPRLDETWGYNHNGDVGDGGVVCRWPQQEEATSAEETAEVTGFTAAMAGTTAAATARSAGAAMMGGEEEAWVLPTCEMATCEGHNEHDVLPFDLYLLPLPADATADAAAASVAESAEDDASAAGAAATGAAAAAAEGLSRASGAMAKLGLVGPQRLTNADLYLAVHPHDERLPYMYDSYEWPWCEQEGIYLT